MMSLKMRNRYSGVFVWSWAIAMVLMLFAACVKVEEEPRLPSQVSLKASIGPVLSSAYTKVTGEIKSTYADTLHIGLAKVTGPAVNFNDAGDECLKAVMHAPNMQNSGLRDIEFESYQGFPDATTEISYVAWYPYGDAEYVNQGTGRTTVSIPVPKDGSQDILYSNIATGTNSRGFNTMSFSHALVKYSIKAYAMETDADQGSVESVWGVPVSVELLEMPAECVLSLPTSAADSVRVSSSGTRTLISPVNSGSLQEGIAKAVELTSFLAPAPSDNILRIRVTTKKGDDTTVKSQTLSIAKNFQHGKHYQIYLRFTTHGTINAEVSVADWTHGGYIGVESNVGIYYDLSETHNANSYIVSSANRYCFNATVRGNGYTGIAGIPGAPADIYKVEDPVSAEIVWTDLVSSTSEDLNQYFALMSKIEEGRVFFNVKTMKEGNVVVGVRDKDDNMLWTWHLWLTDRPVEQGYKNGFAVQDRDLGATAYRPDDATGTIDGLYYQWGRPTPLPLDKQVYAPKYLADGSWEELEVVNFAYDENANAPAVLERVKTPLTYYKATAKSSESNLTKNLWGWRSDVDEYAKTIYDPCPPGYRVPSIRLWRDLYTHNSTVTGTGDAIQFHIDGNETVVYYPMNGFYTTHDNRDNTPGAYMWSATFDLDGTGEPYGLDFIPGASPELQLVTEPSNHAMPVRCISRMSKAHVTNLSDYQTANSYMVEKNGYYKFKATVRGNGVGQLVSPGSSNAIVLTEQLQTVDISSQLVRVEPLWWHSYASPAPTSEELNQGKHFIMLNEGKPDADGYVSFHVEKWYKGNLVLAGRNAKGEIIWSWHIWFTDKPDMMKSNSFVVMDRNLGATYAPVSPTPPSTPDQLNETYGFYYQWGRKDPFLEKTKTVYKYNPGDGTYTTSSSAFSTESVVANKTVANSVQNPMTYHLASEWRPTNPTDVDLVYQYSSFTNLNVYILSQDNLTQNQCYSNMVHPDSRKSFWGYSAAQGYGVTTTKTMYDPCPPGYIVAHYLVWTNTDRILDANYYYYTSLDYGISNHGLTAFENGIFLNYNLGLGDVRHEKFGPSWFPFSGYLSPTTTNRVQPKVGVFHTSTPAGNGSRSIAYNSTQSGQGVSNTLIGIPSSAAYPVRCQKE